jgi:hypothetical protein
LLGDNLSGPMRWLMIAHEGDNKNNQVHLAYCVFMDLTVLNRDAQWAGDLSMSPTLDRALLNSL